MLSLDVFLQSNIFPIYNHCLVRMEKVDFFSYNAHRNFSIFKYTLVIPLLQLYFYRHVTVICQGANSYRKKFPVSKALSSLQILTESFCMLLLQSYILANAWGAYPTVPIGRIINIGMFSFINIVKLLD